MVCVGALATTKYFKGGKVVIAIWIIYSKLKKIRKEDASFFLIFSVVRDTDRIYRLSM